jgi:hypothetical protein
MIPEDGVHQVEFRWEENRDLDVYAHSGLGKPDLDTLRDVVLPVARAPQTSEGPFTSLVHLAFPDGLGSAEGKPLGVILVRRYSPEAGLVAMGAGGQQRLGLMTRALIVPRINVAIPVALGLARRGLSSPQLGEVPEWGRSLYPVAVAEIDSLRQIAYQMPLHLPEDSGWKILDAAVGMLLERAVMRSPNRKLAIEVGPVWTPDLPAGEYSPQLALLACLYHTLRGPFLGLPASEKPWDGSFSTFEVFDGRRGGTELPQIVFTRKMVTGAGMAPAHERLSLQSVDAFTPNVPDIQKAAQKLGYYVGECCEFLWEMFDRFPGDRTVEARLGHFLGKESLHLPGRSTAPCLPDITSDISVANADSRAVNSQASAQGEMPMSVVDRQSGCTGYDNSPSYGVQHLTPAVDPPELEARGEIQGSVGEEKPYQETSAKVRGPEGDARTSGASALRGPVATGMGQVMWSVDAQRPAATGLRCHLRALTFREGASPGLARIMFLVILLQIGADIFWVTRG